ncbi:HeH/LEM domain-containing protein [Desulfonatronovibrio hydrogenovorans]|uniref:DUF7210 family protein n=1 Tax=Desulfonatronovibrio hydrogenovorans TaxID=53245 RepID=UPI000490AEB4|nr:HeH/LEM domain-containing protein [Desulfonatronovibrio hydrogenovorans]
MQYTVKTQIRRGKKRHKPGSTIDLTQKQAARLVAAGAVAPVQEPSGKAQAEAMTVKQLTEKLEELQVEVPTDAKKADLVELYLSAQPAGQE